MKADDSSRAALHFTKPVIKGMVTTVGGKRVVFSEEADRYGLSQAEVTRLQTAVGLEQRYIVASNETTVDLCASSARKLLDGLQVEPQQVSALILVTQSPDHAAPSSAIVLQNMLGLPITSMAFDMRLGCSGFVYGLSVAFSLVESGLDRVLLCVGDTASRFVDADDHSIAPIMGDAGAAILIEKGNSDSYFQMYSDGAGSKALMIPNSGARMVPEDSGKPSLMNMDGPAVFNFTLKRVPGMIGDILNYAGVDIDGIDSFVLHQPNKYILRNLQKRLKIPEEKIPMSTQSFYGNQNSASIPGTIAGFISDKYSSGKVKSLFAGFGIGLSWAACILDTDSIFAPTPIVGLKED